jgi:hypothetical protein
LIIIPIVGIGYANIIYATDVILIRTVESRSSGPIEVMEPADSTQTISLSLGEFDYGIVTSTYSQSHTMEQFTYTITFAVSGGSLEFFICTQTDANLWAMGYEIYIQSSNYWSSTSGVTTTKSFMSNVALAFVFNHESSGSRSVSGSITVDSSPPSITCSLTNNATYNGTVPITASATDSMTGVESMELLIDGTSKKTTSSGSLAYSWGTASYSNGNHTITIKAEDGAGRVATVVYDIWVQNTGFRLPNLDPTLVLGAGLLGAFVIYYLIKRVRARG